MVLTRIMLIIAVGFEKHREDCEVYVEQSKDWHLQLAPSSS